MSRALTEEQNERVRVVAKELIAAGLNQKQLAEQLGVSPATVSRFIQGKEGTGTAIALMVAQLAGVDFEGMLLGRIERVTPSVRQLPEYEAARVSLASSFGPLSLDVATRVLDAAGSRVVSARLLAQAADFYHAIIPVEERGAEPVPRKETKAKGDTAKLLEAHEAVATGTKRKREGKG